MRAEAGFFLTLIPPRRREAVARAIRRNGRGLITPITGAFIVLSTVRIKDRKGKSESVWVGASALEECLDLIFHCWNPAQGNMTWPGCAKQQTSRGAAGVFTPLGTVRAIAKFIKALEGEDVSWERAGKGRIRLLGTSWDDERLQKALTKARWKPPKDSGPDWAPPASLYKRSPEEFWFEERAG